MPPWESVAIAERKCVACGAVFTSKRDSARYCSNPCRNRSRSPRQYDPQRAKSWRESRLARPGYREDVNAKANTRATALRRWIDDYKARVGCVDCGFSNPVALDFDHAGDLKTRNVSACKSIAQAEAEIALCEVRCSNCHRIKTHERRHASSTAS